MTTVEVAIIAANVRYIFMSPISGVLPRQRNGNACGTTTHHARFLRRYTCDPTAVLGGSLIRIDGGRVDHVIRPGSLRKRGVHRDLIEEIVIRTTSVPFPHVDAALTRGRRAG